MPDNDQYRCNFFANIFYSCLMGPKSYGYGTTDGD